MSATKPPPPGNPVPKRGGNPPPLTRGNTPATGGVTPRTRVAADRTRSAWRSLGSGRATLNNHPTVRGFVWVFVWLGVLFYAIANPTAIPKIIHLVFAPVKGVLAVARGTRTSVPKPTTP